MLGEEKELYMDGFYEKPLEMHEEDELANDACVDPFFLHCIRGSELTSMAERVL
jgi:hypothetical protein